MSRKAFSIAVTRIGWTVGAGVEAALSNNWSWKIEYLHMDYGTFNLALVALGSINSQNVKLTDDIVRVGINYKFN